MRALVLGIGVCVALGMTAGASAQGVVQQLQLPIPDFPPGPPLEQNQPKNEKQGRIVNKPIYNPDTKSYLEYYDAWLDVRNINHKYFTWSEAKRWAERRVFHGVRGRLAVIKTREVNDFIVKNFQPDLAWIGLFYRCNSNSLWWVTGENWPLTAYSNWYRPWNRTGAYYTSNEPAECVTGISMLPVHYWGAGAGHRWNANGPAKGFPRMVIEYPTGKP